MLLSTEEFCKKAQEIAGLPGGEIGIDFETQGLRPYAGHKAGIVGFTSTSGEKFCAYLQEPRAYQEALRLLVSNPRLKY